MATDGAVERQITGHVEFHHHRIATDYTLAETIEGAAITITLQTDIERIGTAGDGGAAFSGHHLRGGPGDTTRGGGSGRIGRKLRAQGFHRVRGETGVIDLGAQQ
ncbi:hypothetical protein WH50_04060 [Pokkaliibacter plantistimulans]|uniref:Lipid/polyisoprenoid-binding YceI-like domain-containing protein n=1 Tax=Pokkaliibacter plantistimulans TaxID=1635171 RepID=A0ABX5M0V3_9GAMM|nr:hypothetical protein WH50_04060 [Pokkaliibacter plantistimulans]